MRLLPNEQPPGDDPKLKEWLARMNILTNAGFNDVNEELSNLDLKVILKSESFDIQNPAGTDSPLQIEFGTPLEIDTDEIELSAGGTITYKQSGSTIAFILLSIARANNPQASYMVLHGEKNGVAIPPAVATSLEGNLEFKPFYSTLEVDALVDDTFEAFITRDSSGQNDGGLLPFIPALGSLPSVPSARLVIKKVKR